MKFFCDEFSPICQIVLGAANVYDVTVVIGAVRRIRVTMKYQTKVII